MILRGVRDDGKQKAWANAASLGVLDCLTEVLFRFGRLWHLNNARREPVRTALFATRAAVLKDHGLRFRQKQRPQRRRHGLHVAVMRSGQDLS